MDLKEERQASRSLTCNTMPPRRVAFALDTYAAAAAGDAGPPQPQTATCCTALQRGFAPDSRVQARYAPVRTPGSAALTQVNEDDDHQPQSAKDGVGVGAGGEKMVAAAGAAAVPPRSAMKKAMRKWNSSVEEVGVSQLITETPRLRRSGGMRRDWSFENLRGGNNAA
ncbi:unnamed protein product [Urochloa humidicola]